MFWHATSFFKSSIFSRDSIGKGIAYLEEGEKGTLTLVLVKVFWEKPI